MRTSLLALLALCPLPVAGALRAAPSAAPEPPAAVAAAVALDGEDGEESPLDAAMQTLQRSQRALKRLVGDPAANRDALLVGLGEMEAALIVALVEVPHEFEELEEADRALVHVGYRAMIARTLGEVLAMQEATLLGDAASLGAGYARLGELKKAGHASFRDL
jgi:hypothetical protein